MSGIVSKKPAFREKTPKAASVFKEILPNTIRKLPSGIQYPWSYAGVNGFEWKSFSFLIGWNREDLRPLWIGSFFYEKRR